MSQAVVVHAARDLRFEPMAERPLQEGWARLRFGGGGICGSDLHYFLHGRNGSFAVVEPLILGHEVAGEVIAVNGAPGVTVGDRVAVNPARTCGKCPRCREGRSNLCTDVFFMGSASKRPHMSGVRERLFIWLQRNAVSATDFFRIPSNRVVELGAQVEV